MISAEVLSMRVGLIGALFAVALGICLAYPARAQGDCPTPMTFELLPNGDIDAFGTICPRTSEDFRAFLLRNNRLSRSWTTTLRPESPGGNPFAAMRIGRLIRQHGINVEIASHCGSACTYLAMGGVRRTVTDTGVVAVHRFTSSDPGSGEEAMETAQQFAALLDEYVEEMGVGRGFQRAALMTPNRGIRVLSRDELERFAFVTLASGPALPSEGAATTDRIPPDPGLEASRPPIGGPHIAIAAFWMVSGSVMSLVVEGETYRFYYHEPREGMVRAGVRPGTLLLSGRRSGDRFEGTAYTFSARCGELTYRVAGRFLEDDQALSVEGAAPFVDANCRVARRDRRQIELSVAR